MEIPKNPYGNDAQMMVLLNKIEELEKLNLEYRLTIESNGLQAVAVSETERICITQLKKLAEISDERVLDKSEALIVDTLHRNLLISRNIPVSLKNKEKKKSVEQLLKIVNGTK